MNLVNLTPHIINEVTAGAAIKPSGIVARVDTRLVEVGEVNMIPLYGVSYGEVIDLPEPAANTMYIVSSMVLDVVNRVDVIAPGELVRNESGQPIGCNGFKAKSALVSSIMYGRDMS